ncbi:EAL domain-containing protein [Alkalimonas collagenimarina]|uniref:EAL domain-containing protein n=1 Tax=Alkalimonas collagenimarina TaxID=400390 RepID=A0ABT9GWA0_9GAMM|nr:EAL domain-containing protein [Alkalimonas collagenimarina]MDP4535341.1 EAL domain-containing protein [Alkalimonas collagenimarina]
MAKNSYHAADLSGLTKAIMQNSMDVLAIVNADGYFIQLSEACEAVFGYPREQLMAQPFIDLVHPDDKDITRQEIEKIRHGQETKNFRNRYIRKDGAIVWLMWSARWSDESQTTFAIARDITSLVEQEQISHLRTNTLQQIALNRPLKNILASVCCFYQQHFPGSHCAVLLSRNGLLYPIASAGLTKSFFQAIEDDVIAADSGACGRASFYKETVIVANIGQDNQSASFNTLAQEHSIKACWAFPLLTNDDSTLGTYAVYHKTEKQPTKSELAFIQACSQLMIVAIERERDRNQVQHSEQRYRSLFVSNPDAIFSLDKDGKFTSVNRAGCLLLQMPEDKLLGTRFSALLTEREQVRVQHLLDLTMHGSPKSYELTMIRKNGQQLILQLSHTPIHIDHQVIGVFVIAKDLTEQVRSQESLRLFKRAVESSSNGVVIVDARQEDHPIIFVNKSFERITGYSASEALGKNCRFLQGELRDETVAKEIRLCLQQKAECHVLLKNIRKDGQHFWNELFIAPVPDEEGHISHFVGVQNDVTEKKRYEDELAYNASHDMLTGLPNRALLHDRLRQSCNMSARSLRSLAVMFIDLDGFKLINDSLGHLVGDHLLVEVSKRLSQHIRPGDTLARIGGDEFVVLLPELQHDNDVVTIAERILQHMNETFFIDQRELHISVSIGITLSSGRLEEPTLLIQQADLAMFEAKQLGRNTFQWYNRDLNKELGRQLTLRNELQKALTNKEFELYYQPQFDAQTLELTGVEALLRWKHPTLGMIAPSDFIPIAESSGQIIPLSEWVLETACGFAAQLLLRGYHQLLMAVNISSLQFQRSNFVDSVATLLQKYQLPAGSLELELTESILLSHADSAIEKLHQLKALGVHIAIDDFGTGFSSLSYLKHLPIQKIKIDRSFIRDVIRDRHDAAITKAIISMAHHLQITVIAEGVETKAQVAFLRKHHCNEFQGYYFAKPMPAAELELLLGSQQTEEQLAVLTSEREQQSKHLLLLDDEENILSALKRVLRKENYQVCTATNAEQAFELLALHDIQVVVSDQRMPGMSGTEFLSKVKAMYPDTVRLVLSGYTDLKSVTAAINEGAIYKFLTKPWDDQQLREEIRMAFLHQDKLMQEQAIDPASG